MAPTAAKVNGHATGLPVLKRPATKGHLDKKPKAWRVVEVCIDPVAAQEHRDAQRVLTFLRASVPDAATDEDDARRVIRDAAEKRLADAEADGEAKAKAVDAATKEMLFVGLSRSEKKDAFKAIGFDGEPTGAEDGELINYAMIAASCRIPDDLTAEDVARYDRDWAEAEFNMLLTAALEVMQQPLLVRLGAGAR